MGTLDLETLIAQGSPALDRGSVARIVSCLESSSSELSKSLSKVAKLAHGQFEESEASIVLVSGAVQNLMSVLGQAVEMDPRFEAPTIWWGTTSHIGDKVICLSEEMD